MEFKTISDTENPLFGRREIEGEIYVDVTPSRQEVAKVLAETFSVPAENIKIRTIMGKFGSKVFVINANIYSSKEDKNKVEIQKKKDVEAEKKAEEVAKVSEEKLAEAAPVEPEAQLEEPATEEVKIEDKGDGKEVKEEESSK